MGGRGFLVVGILARLAVTGRGEIGKFIAAYRRQARDGSVVGQVLVLRYPYGTLGLLVTACIS